MRYLGIEGYTRIARVTMEGRDRLIAGLSALDGFHVDGRRPSSPSWAMARPASTSTPSRKSSASAAGSWLGMASPPGIHMGMLSPAHAAVVDEYLADLRAAIAEIRSGAAGGVASAMDHSYGG